MKLANIPLVMALVTASLFAQVPYRRIAGADSGPSSWLTYSGYYMTLAPMAIDGKGRPRVKPGTEPSIEGTLVYPDITGGANWFSPSYSPQTKLFYHSAREVGTTYYRGEADYKPGTAFTGGGGRRMDGDESYGAVRAWEATTGKLRWEFKLIPCPSPSMANNMSPLRPAPRCLCLDCLKRNNTRH